MDSSLETEMFNAFMSFLKMTQQNVTICAGVICQNKSKYLLVCYTCKKLSEAQLNSITIFLNNNLKKIDAESEWKEFNLKIVKVNKDIYCYIFKATGGIKKLARETSKLFFLIHKL